MTPDLLALVLDTLLPGDGPWPPAHDVDLAAAVRADRDGDPDGRIDAVLAALPPGFATADAAGREAMLRAIEAAHAADFERLVTLAYTAYYIAPRVRTVVERETGYANRPPQPLGYELEPFDERLLETQKKRAPFWRPA
ncbi:MAG: hypothetical protein JNK67_22715 [Alphaproteobacteria bacterium]|nr:hypothetical protein [Alphaproteobacteria bacterium]